EHKGNLHGLTLSYYGDGANNMAHSYLLACATAGMNVTVAAPKTHQPDPQIVADAKAIAAEFGTSVSVTSDALAAAKGADIIVTDPWVSMGAEDEKAERLNMFRDYQVTSEVMATANKDAIFMHCLPAYRGFEVAEEVLDGPQSVIWDEA